MAVHDVRQRLAGLETGDHLGHEFASFGTFESRTDAAHPLDDRHSGPGNRRELRREGEQRATVESVQAFLALALHDLGGRESQAARLEVAIQFDLGTSPGVRLVSLPARRHRDVLEGLHFVLFECVPSRSSASRR